VKCGASLVVALLLLLNGTNVGAVELVVSVQASGAAASLSDSDPSIGGEVPLGIGGGASASIAVRIAERFAVGLCARIGTYGHLDESASRTYETSVVLPSLGVLTRLELPFSLSATLFLGYDHGSIFSHIKQDSIDFSSDNDLNGFATTLEAAYRLELGLQFPLLLELGPTLGLNLLSQNDAVFDGATYPDDHLTLYWTFGLFAQATYELR